LRVRRKARDWLKLESKENDLKRLATVVIALIIALSSIGQAQERPAPTPRTPAARRVSKAATTTPAEDVTSLVGLTKAQVEAQLGKPSVALSTVWNYNQPKGTLHVYFKNGVVSESRTTPRVDTSTSAGKGYTNVDGNRIPSPRKADAPPAGASAQCRDGSYSFSAHRSGTCSHHGGVARWL
jgi:hypothetical protein